MRKSRLAIAISALVAVFSSAPAFCASTESLTVASSVGESCRITSVTDMNFGAYNTASVVPTDATGGFDFRCTRNTPFDIYIAGQREMLKGGDVLVFEIYSDPGRTGVWPETNPGVTGVSGSNATSSRTLYGRIPAQQNVTPGNYTGTVTITIQY